MQTTVGGHVYVDVAATVAAHEDPVEVLDFELARLRQDLVRHIADVLAHLKKEKP